MSTKELAYSMIDNLTEEQLNALIVILQGLQKEEPSLTGNYKGFLECHVEPDWLLIYERCSDELVLLLYRTGTHSDLF